MMSNLDNSFSSPQLVWVIEPENKIRFRYESEGGSHGGLAGKLGKKTYPTLKLINYHGRKQISVRVSLYTEDKKEHVLDFKGNKREGSRHYIEEKLQDDNTVEFKHLQIISKKKDEIEEILMERRLNNLKDDMSRSGMSYDEAAVRAHFEKTYRKDVKERARAILNSVRLYFEAFETNKPRVTLCSLFSDVISNQKAAAKGDLRICRLSHVAGSWKGGEEVILLCEKVQKENINVKFYEVDQCGSIIWQEYGHFSPADVHYQYAIPFKTPRYRMNEEKTVSICLERNGEMSEPREFTYKSDKTIPPIKKRKLSDFQSETVSSHEIAESSESASPMNISSPESDINAENQSMSNSQSDDSNQFEVGDEMPFDADAFSTIDDQLTYFINNVLKEEDCQLPFVDLINPEDDHFYNNIDGSCSNLTVRDLTDLPAATAQMDVGQMTDPYVGQMADGMPVNKDCIKSHDIDVALRNLTLKDKSETKPESEFKNNYLNKVLPNRCKDLKASEMSLNQKKQIFNSLLLKRDKFGNTILHSAIFMNRNIVPILRMSHIAQVAIINLQNCKNQTPLHLAVGRNKIKEVKILLQCGGNPNLKDDVGNNCYHIAAQNNSVDILQKIYRFSRFLHNISDFNDEGLTPMHISIMQSNSEYLFELLKFHVKNSNIIEKKAGKSLLHYAVHFQPSLLSKLLEMEDIDVDIQDFEGNTPLHIACANENIEAVKQLLQCGADPSIKNFKQNYDIESSEDDASDGQLPADLTTNIEILKLLRTSTEIEVEDPLDHPNSDTSQESVEMPSHIMEKLCRYLDDEMKWKKLVTYFFDDPVVIDSLSLSPSPTKALLNYVKKEEQGAYLERFKTVLEFAQLTDALNIMNLQHY